MEKIAEKAELKGKKEIINKINEKKGVDPIRLTPQIYKKKLILNPINHPGEAHIVPTPH